MFVQPGFYGLFWDIPFLGFFRGCVREPLNGTFLALIPLFTLVVITH